MAKQDFLDELHRRLETEDMLDKLEEALPPFTQLDSRSDVELGPQDVERARRVLRELGALRRGG